MARDLTLAELAGSSGGGEAAKAAADAATDAAESGESFMDLIKWADENGYLQPFVKAQLGDVSLDSDAVERAPPSARSGEPSEPSGGGEGVPLTAGNIAAFAGAIEEAVGDVPISKVREYAESEPDQVNAIIEEHT